MLFVVAKMLFAATKMLFATTKAIVGHDEGKVVWNTGLKFATTKREYMFLS